MDTQTLTSQTKQSLEGNSGKALPPSSKHRAQLPGLLPQAPLSSGKTNVAALFSAPEFLTGAGEEWHTRKREMS